MWARAVISACDRGSLRPEQYPPGIELRRAQSDNDLVISIPDPAACEIRGPPLLEGSVAMAVDQKIVDALKLSDLKSTLLRNPRVVDIRVEDYVDTDGEDALRVTVILDERVNPAKVSGQDVTDLKRAIRDRIRGLGVELWPYIQLVKQSELDEDVEE
jgi:hypothetical protein